MHAVSFCNMDYSKILLHFLAIDLNSAITVIESLN